MVLPNLAAQELGPLYNKPQLIFAGLVSLVLYFAFVFIQTVRHRDYFLPVETSTPEEHAAPPDNRTTVLSAVLLVVSLVAIVGLAKALTPTVDIKVKADRVPEGFTIFESEYGINFYCSSCDCPAELSNDPIPNGDHVAR